MFDCCRFCFVDACGRRFVCLSVLCSLMRVGAAMLAVFWYCDVVS